MKIILLIILIILLFFSVEQYCRNNNKSLLEIRNPDWFKDITKFPYESFPCKKNCNEYKNTVLKGYENMKKINIVFTGLCIDIENKIDILKKRMEHLGSFFNSYKVVIFENDSKDQTRSLLKNWCLINKNIYLIDCPEDKDCILKNKSAINYGIFSNMRYEKMVDYRNRLLSFVKTNFYDFDCLCMIDLDIGGPISIDGIAHSFGLYNNWDMISSHGLYGITLSLGIPTYYDLLAYEKDNIDFEKNKLDLFKIIIDTNKNIGDDLIKVKSSFAGISFYKMDIINSNIDYTPLDNNYKCEHKIFHDNMRHNGFENIYINPNMTVLVGLQGDYKNFPIH